MDVEDSEKLATAKCWFLPQSQPKVPNSEQLRKLCTLYRLPRGRTKQEMLQTLEEVSYYRGELIKSHICRYVH